ncbi:MAG: PadR family transcriptional regulator [Armatimonadetes bacterium]|nr:PadR family transcriptional regulator [Armatimonadota bacterium]
MGTGKLTELEFVILAMAANGIKSGYAMRKELDSMRGRFSPVSGSVYRVLRRLSERGLVEEIGKSGAPRRERTEYKATTAGLEVVQDWLASSPPMSEVEVINDPLRTRYRYLRAVPKEHHRRILKMWQEENEVLLIRLDKSMIKNPADRMSLMNLYLLAEARGKWLQMLLDDIQATTSGFALIGEAERPTEVIG